MNHIEAMKLALEVLEINLIFLRNVKPFKGQEDLASDCIAMTEEAITALRQAIEQAEQAHSCVACDDNPKGNNNPCAVCGLAQPEQEPVAWRNAALRVGEDLCSVGPFGYYDMTAEQWLDWALSVVTVHAPPPPCQPMTDEEILAIARDHYNPYQRAEISFARAIEAAHGIKGEA
jgi:hypothetical protein